MSREIKFRGFQKTWIYGGISVFENEATIFNVNCVANSAYEVDIKSIGQFTGLKDELGTEIFEGDILDFPFEMGIAYVINDGFRFAVKSPGSEAVDYEGESVLKCTRVIGNIYENPDLLT